MNAWEAKRIAQAPIWREKIIACRSSGMNVRDWCKAEGIAIKTYYRHERIVLDMTPLPQTDGIRPVQSALPALASHPELKPSTSIFAPLPAPVSPVSRRTGQLAATVHLGTATVDVYDGASEDTLQTILRVLKNAE
jgi:hypothetical protein